MPMRRADCNPGPETREMTKMESSQRDLLDDLRDQTARAGQSGLAVSARAPEQRDSIPQGAPVCATHRAPYEFDQDGRRFHLLKDQIHWACWEGSRTLTGVSLGVPPHPDPTEHENPG